jgi:hypothetical protein
VEDVKPVAYGGKKKEKKKKKKTEFNWQPF